MTEFNGNSKSKFYEDEHLPIICDPSGKKGLTKTHCSFVAQFSSLCLIFGEKEYTEKHNKYDIRTKVFFTCVVTTIIFIKMPFDFSHSLSSCRNYYNNFMAWKIV